MERIIGEYQFTHICKLDLYSEEEGIPKPYMPQNDYRHRELKKLHQYGNGPFCRFRVSNTWKIAGVYILTVDDDPHYVGECEQLAKRYNIGYGQISPRNCYEGGQPTNCRINNLVLMSIQAGSEVDLWFLECANRKEIEKALIEGLNTRKKWNRKS